MKTAAAARTPSLRFKAISQNTASFKIPCGAGDVLAMSWRCPGDVLGNVLGDCPGWADWTRTLSALHRYFLRGRARATVVTSHLGTHPPVHQCTLALDASCPCEHSIERSARHCTWIQTGHTCIFPCVGPRSFIRVLHHTFYSCRRF